MCDWHKDEHVYEWNRIENPEIILTVMIIWFLKKVPGQFSWERIIFKQMVLGQLDICVFKKWPQAYFCAIYRQYTKIISKQITYLIVKAKTIKILDDNIEENLCDLCQAEFLDVIPKA